MTVPGFDFSETDRGTFGAYFREKEETPRKNNERMSPWWIALISFAGVVLLCVLGWCAWKLYRKSQEITLKKSEDANSYPFLAALSLRPRTDQDLAAAWANDFWKRENLQSALKKLNGLKPEEKRSRKEELWKITSDKFGREQDDFMRVLNLRNKSLLEKYGSEVVRTPAESRDRKQWVDFESRMTGIAPDKLRRMSDSLFRDDRKRWIADGALYDLREKFYSQKKSR